MRPFGEFFVVGRGTLLMGAVLTIFISGCTVKVEPITVKMDQKECSSQPPCDPSDKKNCTRTAEGCYVMAAAGQVVNGQTCAGGTKCRQPGGVCTGGTCTDTIQSGMCACMCQ
jgi:hypothetical protein